jgi:hypothetical protein
MTTKKKSFFAGSCILTLVILCSACQQKQIKNTEITAGQDSLAVVPFQLEHGGWGYKINVGPKTRIYQDIIPTIQGRHIFQSKDDAQKVGDLMMTKMRQSGTQFPVISRQEMLDMKIAGVQ